MKMAQTQSRIDYNGARTFTHLWWFLNVHHSSWEWSGFGWLIHNTTCNV